MLIKVTNGQVEKAPYSIGEFRKSKPNVSFPKEIPTSVLEENGVYTVKEVSPPAVDKNTHSYTWTVELKDGVWTQVWSTTELPQEKAESNIRGYRDRLLSESDWTQVADTPVDSSAWAVYRQTLRDIPSQEGFPYSVTWPVQPE